MSAEQKYSPLETQDTFIEVQSSDGSRTVKIPISEYLRSKKLSQQLDLIPRIIIVYICHLLALFGHAIIALNLNSVDEEDYRLKDGEKMVNWILFTLYLYYFIKTA